jgi:uncharacterized RDD family membrane protein YckC
MSIEASMEAAETVILGESATIPLQTPSLKRRMACWMYEGILMFGVAFISGYLFSTMSQQRHALNHRIGLMAFLFLIFGIYFTWFWAKGQTLAMKTWNIRLVTTEGKAVTQMRAMFRYVCSWVWLLPPLAMISPFNLSGAESALIVVGWVWVWALLSRFQPEKQFWHDDWAGTRLIDSKPLSR